MTEQQYEERLAVKVKMGEYWWAKINPSSKHFGDPAVVEIVKVCEDHCMVLSPGNTQELKVPDDVLLVEKVKRPKSLPVPVSERIAQELAKPIGRWMKGLDP